MTATTTERISGGDRRENAKERGPATQNTPSSSVKQTADENARARSLVAEDSMADGTPRTRCFSAHTDGNLCDECRAKVAAMIPRLIVSTNGMSLEEAEALYESVRDLDEDCAGQLMPTPLAFGEWIPLNAEGDPDEVPLDAWREYAAAFAADDRDAHWGYLDEMETLGDEQEERDHGA